jgi:hypothetical protein
MLFTLYKMWHPFNFIAGQILNFPRDVVPHGITFMILSWTSIVWLSIGVISHTCWLMSKHEMGWIMPVALLLMLIQPVGVIALVILTVVGVVQLWIDVNEKLREWINERQSRKFVEPEKDYVALMANDTDKYREMADREVEKILGNDVPVTTTKPPLNLSGGTYTVKFQGGRPTKKSYR